MHPQEFEQKFFELVFRTNIKLTPHVIAYRLGLPFQEVRQHLDLMTKENIVSLEIDAGGVITYEVLGAERPARDWLATAPSKVQAPKPTPQEMGRWFAGPAAEEPPKPVYIEPDDEAVAFVSSPSRSWLWVPLLLIFGLFLLPFMFGLLFFCVSDSSGFGLFFLLSIVLLKVACGAGSCVETSRACRRHMGPRRRSH